MLQQQVQAQLKQQKRKNKIATSKKINQQISNLRESINPNGEYTMQQAINDAVEKSGAYNKAHIIAQSAPNRTQNSYYYRLGEKVLSSVLKQISKDGKGLDSKDVTTLEILLLADDWFDTLKKGITMLAPHVVPYVSKAVEIFAPQLAQSLNPIRTNSDGETCSIKRRWLLTPVGSTSVNTSILLPASPARYPFGKWLSQIANAYQFYTIKSLVIEYVPTASVTTSGNVSYFLDLDLSQNIPAYEDIAQQYKAQQHAVYQSSRISFNQDELQQVFKRYKCTRQPQPDAQQEYDFAQFIFGSSVSSVVGNFFIEMELEFSIPVLAIQAIVSDYIQLVWTASENSYDTWINSLTSLNHLCQLTGETRQLPYAGIDRTLTARRTLTSIPFFATYYYRGTNAVAIGAQARFYTSTNLLGALTSVSPIIVTSNYITASGNQHSFVVESVLIPQGVYLWLLPTISGVTEVANQIYWISLQPRPSSLGLDKPDLNKIIQQAVEAQMLQYQRSRPTQYETPPNLMYTGQQSSVACENGE